MICRTYRASTDMQELGNIDIAARTHNVRHFWNVSFGRDLLPWRSQPFREWILRPTVTSPVSVNYFSSFQRVCWLLSCIFDVPERTSLLSFLLQSKKAFERITVPKIYHPFITGANNEKLNQLQAETNTRINVPPPPSVDNEDITIAGEKEGVETAKNHIMRIYNEMVGIWWPECRARNSLEAAYWRRQYSLSVCRKKRVRRSVCRYRSGSISTWSATDVRRSPRSCKIPESASRCLHSTSKSTRSCYADRINCWAKVISFSCKFAVFRLVSVLSAKISGFDPIFENLTQRPLEAQWELTVAELNRYGDALLLYGLEFM